METQLACLANIGQNWLLGAVDEARRWSVRTAEGPALGAFMCRVVRVCVWMFSRGSAHESIVPYQAFECKDGMYMVGAGNDRQV
jgi:crotonobetainyl-CoA:carnitine CoA-transferase CaiB-like acyl-CoA transferase